MPGLDRDRLFGPDAPLVLSVTADPAYLELSTDTVILKPHGDGS